MANTSPSFAGYLVLIGIGIYGVSRFVGGPAGHPENDPKIARVSGTNLSELADSKGPRVWDAMPADEQAFIVAVQDGAAAFGAGENDMQKGAARPARAKRICGAIPSRAAKEWLGKIDKLSSNSDGKGVLSLQVAPNIYVQTRNNYISDVSDKTLIEPNSQVFSKVSVLKEGDWIRFSGDFKQSEVDCVEESSLGLDGSMTEPAFIFGFTDAHKP